VASSSHDRRPITDQDLTVAVLKLSAILDGFPVEIRHALTGPRKIPRWGKVVIFGLMVSLASNAATVFADQATVARAQQALSRANQTLVVAQQQQQTAQEFVADAKRLERICFHNAVAVYLGGESVDPRCSPDAP
jgi:hypothetical protein